MQNQLKTSTQVIEQLRFQGLSISEWANAHGFSPWLVYSVLKREGQVLRGQSHDVAVMLGLKAGVVRANLKRRAARE